MEAQEQAEAAQQELQAYQEQQRIAAETEVIRTQALQAQLLHEEAVAEILREITRIRLAGQSDRARLTNEWLIRMEADAAEFAEEVAEIEATIQV